VSISGLFLSEYIYCLHLLCVFWRIVKARKVDRALHNVFCIVTLSIVIYVDNICIRWETDQKYSPKTLIGSVIVSVLANCLKRILQKTHKRRLFEYMSKFIFCHLPHSVGNLWFRVLFLQNPNKKLFVIKSVQIAQCILYCYVIYCHLCRQYMYSLRNRPEILTKDSHR
jgi:hypothetical protein